MDVKICELYDSKSDEVAKLLGAMPDYFGIPEANTAYIENANSLPILAAYQDSELLGLAALRVHGSKTTEIYLMGVLPLAQSRGVGQKLLQVVEARAIKLGHVYMTVWTLTPEHPDKGYQRTRKFYEANGFSYLCDEHNLSGQTALYVKNL